MKVPSVELGRRELPRPGLLREIARLGADVLERLPVRIANDRDEQGVLGRHGDADVDLGRVTESLLAVGRIHAWVLTQRDGARLDDEVVERRLRVERRPPLGCRRHVDLDLDRERRDGRGLEHVASDACWTRESGSGAAPGRSPPAACSTSSLVIIPFGPLPWTAVRSTPRSAAIRFAIGRGVDARGAGGAGCRLRRGLGIDLGRSRSGGRCGCPLLARRADSRDRRADRGRLALGDEDLEQRPVALGLVLHRRLVRVDLDERLAACDLGALRDEPLCDRSLLHRVGEAGHDDFDRHFILLEKRKRARC